MTVIYKNNLNKTASNTSATFCHVISSASFSDAFLSPFSFSISNAFGLFSSLKPFIVRISFFVSLSTTTPSTRARAQQHVRGLLMYLTRRWIHLGISLSSDIWWQYKINIVNREDDIPKNRVMTRYTAEIKIDREGFMHKFLVELKLRSKWYFADSIHCY